MMIKTFSDYQREYETSFFSYRFKRKWKEIQERSYRFASTTDFHIQGVDLLIKCVHYSLFFTSCYFPLSIEIPQRLLKDARRLTDLMKGIKSIDCLINFKFSWKAMTLTLSGWSLVGLSVITILERYQLFNVENIHKCLEAIPVFGILPYGGVLSVSLIGLVSMIALIAWDKRKKSEGEASRIQNTKISFWSSLDKQKVVKKIQKIEEKIYILRQEMDLKASLIRQGQSRQQKKITQCEVIIQELNEEMEPLKRVLEDYEAKCCHWKLLLEQWDTTSLEKIEQFRLAKYDKWKRKLQKARDEKRAQEYSLVNYVMIIALQLISIGTGVLNYHSSTVNHLKVGMDVFGMLCHLKGYFMKRTIRQIKFSAIPLRT